ncbi:MAG: ABC transporter substrate-binding protein [Thermoanaerobaculaceae bacterium]|nr:ABC transporter substrate-binding protein [Thermoanaerobaculaceae bacterium]
MKRATLAVLLVPLLAAGACSRKLVVGVVLPETGEMAAYGASVKSGVKLAFDDAIAAKTAPPGLIVEYRDSGSDPTRAASALEALYSAGAPVVIGGATTAEAKVMIPIAARRERVLLSPSASAPDLARVSVFFFRTFPSDDLEGVKAADLFTLTKNVRVVAILQEDNPYTRGLLPVFMGQFRTSGGTVVGSVAIGEPGWERQTADTLASYQPKGVYICGYGEAIVAALKVLRQVGYTGVICTTSAISSASVLKEAGKLAEGVYFPLAAFDPTAQQEPIRRFVTRYHEVYKLVPDIYAAHGYDAALAVLYALKASRTPTGKEVQLRLKGLSEMRGVTGPLAFDDFGNIKHYLRNYWIHDGKVEDYDSYVKQQQERIKEQMWELLQGQGL